MGEMKSEFDELVYSDDEAFEKPIAELQERLRTTRITPIGSGIINKRHWRKRLREVERTYFVPKDLVPYVTDIVIHSIPLAMSQPFAFPKKQLQRLVSFGAALELSAELSSDAIDKLTEINTLMEYWEERSQLKIANKVAAFHENRKETGSNACIDSAIQVINEGHPRDIINGLTLRQRAELELAQLFPERGITEWIGPKRKICGVYNDQAQPPIHDLDPTVPGIYSVWRTFNTSEGSKAILSGANRGNILKGRWLNDIEISAGMLMLKRAFPDIEGLCDTIYCPRLVPNLLEETFIQLFLLEARWICIQNLCPNGKELLIYDSAKDTVKRNLQGELQSIAITSVDMLYRFLDVQQQEGANDCGLFALAFATSLCFGEDPTSRRYDQSRMRAHYVACVDDGVMTVFP